MYDLLVKEFLRKNPKPTISFIRGSFRKKLLKATINSSESFWEKILKINKKTVLKIHDILVRGSFRKHSQMPRFPWQRVISLSDGPGFLCQRVLKKKNLNPRFTCQIVSKKKLLKTTIYSSEGYSEQMLKIHDFFIIASFRKKLKSTNYSSKGPSAKKKLKIHDFLSESLKFLKSRIYSSEGPQNHKNPRLRFSFRKKTKIHEGPLEKNLKNPRFLNQMVPRKKLLKSTIYWPKGPWEEKSLSKISLSAGTSYNNF